jgi:hypothetical protein
VPARRQENSVTAPSIVLLTEEALTPADAERLTALHADEGVRYQVLVPADVERNLLADVLDHLSLFQLREALEAVRGEEETTRAEAATALEESLAALTGAGVQAEGRVVAGDPVAELQKTVAADPDAQEVIVVTRPHAVEDTFHRDWASRARELLGVPVLHVYAGSSFLG